MLSNVFEQKRYRCRATKTKFELTYSSSSSAEWRYTDGLRTDTLFFGVTKLETWKKKERLADLQLGSFLY